MNLDYKPKNNLEKFGFQVFTVLVENFPHTYYVGGMVRDFLLGRKIIDIDLATSAKPEEVAAVLRKHNVQTDLSASRFGVVKVKQGNLAMEVATFRKDTYTNSRYPTIAFTTSLRADSNRRDFTVNALYFSPKTSVLLDFHNGLIDLKKKQISFIGKPEKRIQEDPLRIVRGLRFALVLNFKLEAKTKRAIKNNFSLLGTLTKTRIENEIKKIKNKNSQKVLKKVINNPLVLDKYF